MHSCTALLQLLLSCFATEALGLLRTMASRSHAPSIICLAYAAETVMQVRRPQEALGTMTELSLGTAEPAVLFAEMIYIYIFMIYFITS